MKDQSSEVSNKAVCQAADVTPTALERALSSHPQVAEVVVVPLEFRLGRQVFSAFITLRPGSAESEGLRAELAECLRASVQSQAIPENIHFVPHLPKTRSGKMIRDVEQFAPSGNASG